VQDRESWHNLAVVHERLGETDLANRARHEANVCTSGAGSATGSSSMVRWVDAREFGSMGRGVDTAAPPTQLAQPNRPQSPSVPKSAAKNSGFSWPWK
jgi:hypothetical protein